MSEIGIYGPEAVALLGSYSDAEADRNVHDWLDSHLPTLDGGHFIDWGAGVGRFVSLYRRCGAGRISLVEPSPSAIENLCNKFGRASNIELIQAEIGTPVSRSFEPEKTIHVSTFVINCMESIQAAFQRLESVVLPGERLMVVTNIFAPASIVSRIRSERAQDAISGDLGAWGQPVGRLPRTKAFTNQLIENGLVLTDSVHTLDQVVAALKGGWATHTLDLMLPNGFCHVVQPGEDFGDYRFAVLAAELERGA